MGLDGLVVALEGQRHATATLDDFRGWWEYYNDVTLPAEMQTIAERLATLEALREELRVTFRDADPLRPELAEQIAAARAHLDRIAAYFTGRRWDPPAEVSDETERREWRDVLGLTALLRENLD